MTSPKASLEPISLPQGYESRARLGAPPLLGLNEDGS